MPAKPLGTEPDLNLGPLDVPRFSREALGRHYRHRWHREGRTWTEPELNAAVEAASREPDLDAPRVRVKRGAVEDQRVFVRRDGREVVRYSNGLVELANLPDFDFDFRVRFELIQTDSGPVLAPSAVAVIARAGDVGSLRGSDFTSAGIARAIKTAARALTRRQGVDDTGRPVSDRRADGRDVELLLPREAVESRFRTSSRSVEDEARAVARAWHEVTERNGGVPPRGYAATIAGELGWGVDARWAERVRKRVAKAVRMGLIPPASRTRSKHRA